MTYFVSCKSNDRLLGKTSTCVQIDSVGRASDYVQSGFSWFLRQNFRAVVVGLLRQVCASQTSI
jgi:hypothetical protein